MTEDQKTDLHDYMKEEFPNLLEGERFKDTLAEMAEFLRTKLAEKRRKRDEEGKA